MLWKICAYVAFTLFILLVMLVVFLKFFGTSTAHPNQTDSALIRSIEAKLLPPPKAARVAVEQVYGKAARKTHCVKGNARNEFIWEYEPMAGFFLVVCYESDRVAKACFEHREGHYNIALPSVGEWARMDVKAKERRLQEFLDSRSPLPW